MELLQANKTVRYSAAKRRGVIVYRMHAIALALLLSIAASGSNAATIVGEVVGLADGDALTILDASNTQYRVRLAGIDAPEKRQAFGSRSGQHLGDMVFRKNVSVEWNKTDRYGRVIGKVLVNGVDVNLSQIRAGLAWHYKQYQSEQSAADRELYASAETKARAVKIGLWEDAEAIAPWDFRHMGRH